MRQCIGLPNQMKPSKKNQMFKRKEEPRFVPFQVFFDYLRKRDVQSPSKPEHFRFDPEAGEIFQKYLSANRIFIELEIQHTVLDLNVNCMFE